jgi:hypothetical protein
MRNIWPAASPVAQDKNVGFRQAVTVPSPFHHDAAAPAAE